MTHTYSLNNKKIQSVSQFLNFIQNKLPLIKDTRKYGFCYYFDTFDWRLYREGYYLYFIKDEMYFYQWQKRKIEASQEYYLKSLDEFNRLEGILEERVSPIIGIRALMCRATFRLTGQTFRILNNDQKTIARIYFEQGKIKNSSKYISLPSFIEIKPLRGYANQVPGILRKLSALKISPLIEDRLKRGLAAVGKFPADYSSKLSIQLTSGMSAHTASKQIFLDLLKMIRKNEYGIINDIDTEFLHDFRVAIRRTRSALAQLKNTLDEKTVIKAKENFSFLGRSTNKLRDIDVYLLREKKYKSMLPPDLRNYLNPFFKSLHTKRESEHKALVRMLRSVKYRRILSTWNRYLNSSDRDKRSSTNSAKTLARIVITNRNIKVLKFGTQIMETGSDDLLHQLRIEGKKLRYLLEFFSSLFNQKKILYLVGKLKILQDNLG